MLFTAYEALLSPHVRSDERTDAAVLLLIEKSVEARVGPHHTAGLSQPMVPASKIEVIESKLEFCDAHH
jgi:hypothetical protein